MNTKGGRFTLTINGQTFSGRGKATIKPSVVSIKNGVNMDGSGYSTVKPELAAIDLTFDRGVGLLWDATMMLQAIDVTFQELDTGLTHLLTAGNWDGAPAIDSENGEVTGLKMESDQYTPLNA